MPCKLETKNRRLIFTFLVNVKRKNVDDHLFYVRQKERFTKMLDSLL